MRQFASALAAALAACALAGPVTAAEPSGAPTPARPVAEVVERDAPLVIAARNRDGAALDKLLAAKPTLDVNQRTSDGTTALHWAIYHNDLSLFDKLMSLKPDVNAKNDYGATPLSEAAVTGNTHVIKALLKAGADVESPNADGQTALMAIARTSNVEAAKLLLDKRASVNAREQWRGQTPLMWAAAEAQPEMVKLLIKHRADVNARSAVNDWERQVTSEPRMQARPSGGFTPLLYAARKGCNECAQLLLKAGADKDLTDPDGVTPLLLATLNFNFDVATTLIEAGANVNKWDAWGRSPLYAAVDMNTLPTGGRADRPSLDKTSSLQLIETLLKAGANPNLQLKLFPPYRSLRDDRGADTLLGIGTTPLIRASKAGDLPVMRLLLAHGAKTELDTETGITPLMAAAGNGSSSIDTRGRYKTEAQAVEAVQLLLASGADINARDRGGQTALHGAASWGWNGLVKTLVANKADIVAKDARGRTPADIAKGAQTSSGRATAQAHPETEALLRKLAAEAGTVPSDAAKSATSDTTADAGAVSAAAPPTAAVARKSETQVAQPLAAAPAANLAASSSRRAGFIKTAAVTPRPLAATGGPRLYILDCGTIAAMDPKLYSLEASEIKRGDTSFVSPCYLVVHPKGTLIWDVGQVPDAEIPDDGTEVARQNVLKAKRKLAPQLAALGYQPKDITYLAMSHYHADHTANANMFAGSTWIVQQAEYDMMFGDAKVGIRDVDSYKDLKTAKRITLKNADHDVFGDGTVVIKTAPGHTPGHQMLFLKLNKFGPLLLAGDLYHLPEERTLDRVPTFDFDAAMTRATRKKVDEFVAQTHATFWIQHDPATHAPLKKAPQYYD